MLRIWLLCIVCTTHTIATRPQPTQRQMEFMDMGFTQFMHYNLATYSMTTKHRTQHNCYRAPCLSPSIFKPTNLSTDQWVSAAKQMGAGEICLTAHHEGGFCLWPSKYTNYTVMASPYPHDIVKMFVDSCRKYDIRPCFYMGPNADGYLTKVMKVSPKKFIELQLGMTKELLTNYGPISRLWWDHYPRGCGRLAMCPGGFPDGWTQFIKEVRSLSPNTLMGTGPDVEHSHGGESGDGSYPIWNYCNISDGIVRHCDKEKWGPFGNSFQPREADATIQNPGDRWFWEPNVPFWNASQIWKHYFETVGRGDNFIFNLPPDETGQIPERYVKAVTEFGNALRATFHTAVANISGAVTNCGSPTTLMLGKDAEFDTVLLREDLMNPGQSVEQYKLEILVDGKWNQISQGVHGKTIGNRVVDFIPMQKGGTQFRVVPTCPGGVSSYKLGVLAVFKAKPP
eukprot:TRINITY_DN13168_c0_g1_i1.p1 TRINITY_DN13168_c0_g1~~TRINITY_DN13168_c0_g1_i1.p1  ORF type:complete len:468 (-),score=20.02 TRINITY_DN13168_c0_g1_i1:91-1452(-)